MTHTNTEALSDAVTREDAIKFLEGACRNWSKVPRLSEEDIGDVASELLRFALSRRSASNTGGVEVKAELRDLLHEMRQKCKQNATSGSSDERQAWSGMADLCRDARALVMEAGK